MTQPGAMPATPNGFTLEAIQPLIHSSQVDGRSLTAVFRCPTTQKRVRASWNARPTGVSAAVEEARNTVRFKMRAQVNGMVRGLLGFGVLARTARRVSDAALSSGTGLQLTAVEEEQALVAAFRSVSAQFAWQESRWVHGSHLHPTSDRLESVTDGLVLSDHDRDIAARMLVEVARAHGGITDEERLHLVDAFHGRLDALDSLLVRPPLADAELAATDHRVRTALLGVAWSMAFCESSFDQAEEDVIERFADGMGVTLEERVEAKRAAQVHVLDAYLEQAFDWGTFDQGARDGLARLASKIGVTRAAAERAEVRYRKRRSPMIPAAS